MLEVGPALQGWPDLVINLLGKQNYDILHELALPIFDVRLAIALGQWRP